MDPNSTKAAFCLQVDPNWKSGPCIEGSFDGLSGSDSQVLIFTPTVALSEATNYIVTIDTNATDPNGIAMPETFILKFKTASVPTTLTFTGVGCFIQSIKEGKISIFERFKDWLHFNPQE